MNTGPATRSELLQRAKNGKLSTGSSRLLMFIFGIGLAAVIDGQVNAFRGTENFKLVLDLVSIIYICVVSVFSVALLEMDRRLKALVELIEG